MKRRVSIVLDNCGPELCSSAPGQFCPHVLTKRMGTVWICGVFRHPSGADIELEDTNGDGTGSLKRCPECLAADEGEA
jgi:hypothetical protein